MTRIIDCTIPDAVSCKLSRDWRGKLKFDFIYRLKWKPVTYTEADIASIAPIDEDRYRSAGGAAAGAIIGGVLTGGVGFLIGAAIGGRRRSNATFLVEFTDGQRLAFEEKKGGNIKAISRILESERYRAMMGKPDQGHVEGR